MNAKTAAAVLLGLSLAASGCIRFKQPKEFKNRKSKQDPPILEQLPLEPGERTVFHKTSERT